MKTLRLGVLFCCPEAFSHFGNAFTQQRDTLEKLKSKKSLTGGHKRGGNGW